MKRFISMLLSISMMLSLCSSSLSVSAVDTTSTVQTEGTGQVSTLFEDELNEKLADLSNDFGITSVEVNNNKAVVKYHATRDCTVLIGIYEDDGTKGTHMLSFEKGELKATEVETTITLNNLPNYFYLKAYLIDSETYKPLSKVYDTPNYTKNMKEFFERTVDDFPEERVWNLDDSKTNNFMVVAENTKVLNSRLEIDSADITYTVNTISIKNNADADKNIASLKSGDPFMLFCETGVLHGIISTITFSEDGKKAEITYSEAQTGDLFEHIRIDTSDIVKSEVATYSPRRIIDYAPPEIKPEVTPFSVGASFNVSNEDSDNDNDKEGVNISGNVEATFGVAVEGEVKIYYSSEEKDEVDYLEINCTPKITVSAEGEGSITLNKTWFDKRIELVNVPVPPLGIPTIPIVTARLSLSSSASVTVSGKAEVTFVVPGEFTITADMHSDKPLTHRFEKVEPTANAEAAITFAGTVALTAKVCVCDIEIAALASAGVKLEIKEEIKFYKDLSNDPNSPEHGYVKHSCGALECISGTNSISFTATIFFESPILKLMPETDFGELGSENEIDKVTLDLGEGKISYELINKELLPENMRDFYIRTNPFSFNYGKCKNKSYLTFFNIRDTYNNIPVTGATVKYGKEVFVNEENGVVSFFIPCGTSAKITVEHEDYLPCTYTTNVITDYKTYEDIDITHKKAITKITPIPVETKSPVIYVHGDDLRFTSLKIEYADGTSKSIPFFVDGRINKEIKIKGYDPHKLVSIQDVTISYQNATYNFKIKVVADERAVESIEAVPAITEYYLGDPYFNPTNGKVIIHYTDGTIAEKSLHNCTLSGFNTKKIGNVTMTATYTDDHGNTVSDTFDIVVNGPVGLEWLNYPEKTVYNYGEEFDTTAGLLTVNYFNGNSDIVYLDDEKVTIIYDPEKLGEQIVIIKYDGYDGYLQFNVNVMDKAKNCRVASLAKTHYFVGEELDLTDAMLEITYRGGETILIPITADMVSGFDNSVIGDCMVKVNYNDSISGTDFETTFTVKIIDGNIMPCELIVVPVHANYYIGMSRYEGIEFNVKIIYTDYSIYDVGTIAVPTDDYYYYDENIGYIHITGCDKYSYGLQTVDFTYEGISTTSYVMLCNERDPRETPVKDGLFGVAYNANGHKDFDTEFDPGEPFEIKPGSYWAVIHWREDEYGNIFPVTSVPDEDLHSYTTSSVLNKLPSSPTTEGFTYKILLLFNTEFGKRLCGATVRVLGTGSMNTLSYSLANDSDLIVFETENDNTALNNIDDSSAAEDSTEIEPENDNKTSDEMTEYGNENVTETAEVEIVPTMTNNSEPISVLSTLKTAAFTDLLTDEIYNYYVVKNASAADIFSKDNLLFIGQAVSDGRGNLSVEYETTTGEDGDIILKPMSYINLSNAEIDIDNPVYNGKEQVVIPVIKINGKLLEKDIDYTLGGDTTARDVGKYTIVINGIGDYTGSVQVSYEIKKSSSDDTTNPPVNSDNNNTYVPSMPSNIPSVKTWNVPVENLITGKTTSATAKLNGSDITVNLGVKNNGYYANLYSETDELIDAVLIKKGSIKIVGSEDDNFRIVIDTEPHYEYDDVSSDAGIFTEEQSVDFSSEVPYAAIIVIIAVTGAFVMELKKRHNK